MSGQLVKVNVSSLVSRTGPSPLEFDQYGGVSIKQYEDFEEWSSVGKCIQQTKMRADSVLRFGIGDWYNRIPTSVYGERKRRVIEVLGTDLAHTEAKNCGWIAGRWDVGRRRLNEPRPAVWGFYKALASKAEGIQDAFLDRWLQGGLTMKELYKQLKDSERKPTSMEELLRDFRELIGTAGLDYVSGLIKGELNSRKMIAA